MRKLIRRINEYMYDSSVDIKDRTFMLFSIAVLAALFLAIPFGLIMQEPLSATISAFLGFVFFILYVIYAFTQKRIKSAKIIILIKSTTDIKVPVDKIYVALSGDQCAITNIRIYS